MKKTKLKLKKWEVVVMFFGMIVICFVSLVISLFSKEMGYNFYMDVLDYGINSNAEIENRIEQIKILNKEIAIFNHHFNERGTKLVYDEYLVHTYTIEPFTINPN